MSLITMMFALNAPVRTPEQRVVLMFLAEFSNTEDQTLCEVDELCERIPIEREKLENALNELRIADIIRMRWPIKSNLIRVSFNLGDV